MEKHINSIYSMELDPGEDATTDDEYNHSMDTENHYTFPDMEPAKRTDNPLLYTRQYSSIHSKVLNLRFSELALMEVDKIINENMPKWNFTSIDRFEIDIKLENKEIYDNMSPLFDKIIFVECGTSAVANPHFIAFKSVDKKCVDFICIFTIHTSEEFKCLHVDFMCDKTVKTYINRIKAVLKNHQVTRQTVQNIAWGYSDNRAEMSFVHILEKFDEELIDEAYPFLSSTVDEFVKDYLASSEPILVLVGPPGTGKTRLIRYICQKMQMTPDEFVYYSMDSTILKTDEFFIKYLTDNNSKCLVLEDMDFSLRSRKDGNADMYRLLGGSDGFIQGTCDKKLIISTNASISNIDDALMRPGRCYGAIQFRLLDLDEAKCVLKKIKPEKEFRLEDKKNYSLAELYSMAKMSKRKDCKFRVIQNNSIGFY